jgi:hypothetical protein
MAEERNRTDLDTHTIWIFLLFAVLAIALAIVLLFRADQSAAVASLVAGIVALCVLLAFLPILGSVKEFGFGPGGLRVILEQIDAKVEDARRKIDRFIFLSMPRLTYDNLKKIAGPKLGGRTFGQFDMNDGFRQQLRFLRDNGFIDVKAPSIGQLASGHELSEIAEVTSLGLEFIEYREKLGG